MIVKAKKDKYMLMVTLKEIIVNKPECLTLPSDSDASLYWTELRK